MSVQLTFADTPVSKQPHDYSTMLKAVVEAVGDGQLRTLAQIEAAMDFRYAQTSISARIRDLRRGLLPGWSSERVTKITEDGIIRLGNWYRVFRREE